MQWSQLESLMTNLWVLKVGDNFEDKIFTDSPLPKLFFRFKSRRQFWDNIIFFIKLLAPDSHIPKLFKFKSRRPFWDNTIFFCWNLDSRFSPPKTLNLDVGDNFETTLFFLEILLLILTSQNFLSLKVGDNFETTIFFLKILTPDSHLPKLLPNLVSALAGLEVNNFPHLGLVSWLLDGIEL